MNTPQIPQAPLLDENGNPFYPITQYNQIVMKNHGRWNGVQIPNDGVAGQVLVRTGDNSDNIKWDNIKHNWDDINNKPEQLDKANVEEWTFTLDDGTVIKRKVLIND